MNWRQMAQAAHGKEKTHLCFSQVHKKHERLPGMSKSGLKQSLKCCFRLKVAALKLFLHQPMMLGACFASSYHFLLLDKVCLLNWNI